MAADHTLALFAAELILLLLTGMETNLALVNRWRRAVRTPVPLIAR